MPNSQQCLQSKQKCHRNYQQSQQKQLQVLALQHSISAKDVKRHDDDAQNQIVALIAIILIEILISTVVLADGPVASSTSGAIIGGIRGDNPETASNENINIIGEIVEENRLDAGSTGDGNTDTQYQNGFHSKFTSVDKEVGMVLYQSIE